MKNINIFSPENILNSIADGIYVTDLDRKILYWNTAAERITGWQKQDVLGKSCMDGILCHADKENRPLCGESTCPLYRAVHTGQPSTTPVIVFAQNREGNRVPVQVNVAPIRNDAGDIIGGVEVFRDVSDIVRDLNRAQKIQKQALKWNLSKDAKLKASAHYIPQDMIGGDFYAFEQVSQNQYLFLLADVMGHGTSAALYTMYLRSLWEEYFDLLPDIPSFLKTINQQLYPLMHGTFSFAAAVCGMIDMDQKTVTLAGGAFPKPFLFNRTSLIQPIDISGFALGMFKNADYPAQTLAFHPGDILFLYTDGAIENPDQSGKELGEERLIKILQEIGYPQKSFLHQEIENRIIEHAAYVALKDDVTFLEFQWPLGVDV